MKATLVSTFAFFGLQVQGVRLGPEACVSLDRSAAGACVIRTDCEGLSSALSTFEFAFSCKDLKNKELIRHSFGVGGFAEHEEFDTEIKCDRCLAPVALGVRSSMQHQALGPSGQQQPMVARAQASPSEPMMGLLKEPASTDDNSRPPAHQPSLSDAADSNQNNLSAPTRYGPNACISTYKATNGNCVLKTDCSSSDLKDYKVGFVCVDQLGAPVRHVFRAGSFRTKEAFDTLVQCAKCLGTEDIPNPVALNGLTLALSSQVRSLSKMLSEVSSEVKELSEEIEVQNASGSNSQKAAGKGTHNATSQTTQKPAAQAPRKQSSASETLKAIPEKQEVTSQASASESSSKATTTGKEAGSASETTEAITKEEVTSQTSASETSKATRKEVKSLLSQATQTRIVQSLGNLRGWGAALLTEKQDVADVDGERQQRSVDRERQQLQQQKDAERERRELQKKEDLELEDALSSISSALEVAKSYRQVEKASGGVKGEIETPSKAPVAKQILAASGDEETTQTSGKVHSLSVEKAPVIKQSFSSHGKEENTQRSGKASAPSVAKVSAFKEIFTSHSKRKSAQRSGKARAKKRSRRRHNHHHLHAKTRAVKKRKTREVHEDLPTRRTDTEGDAEKHTEKKNTLVPSNSAKAPEAPSHGHHPVVFAQEASEEKNLRDFQGHFEDADIENDASDASDEVLVASVLD